MEKGAVLKEVWRKGKRKREGEEGRMSEGKGRWWCTEEACTCRITVRRIDITLFAAIVPLYA